VRQHEEAHQPPPESEYIPFAVIERHIFREVPAESNGPHRKHMYLLRILSILCPMPILRKRIFYIHPVTLLPDFSSLHLLMQLLYQYPDSRQLMAVVNGARAVLRLIQADLFPLIAV